MDFVRPEIQENFKRELEEGPVMIFDTEPQEPTDYEIIEYYKAKVSELEQTIADMAEEVQEAIKVMIERQTELMDSCIAKLDQVISEANDGS